MVVDSWAGGIRTVLERRTELERRNRAVALWTFAQRRMAGPDTSVVQQPAVQDSTLAAQADSIHRRHHRNEDYKEDHVYELQK